MNYTDCSIRSLYSGFVGDWITLKFARRNKGISETENKLWLYIFPVVAYPFGFLLWGVGAAHGIHCKRTDNQFHLLSLIFSLGFGLAFAAFLQTAAAAATITLSITYCIDTYTDLSGEVMVTVIVIRNTMGWAITAYA